MRPRRLRDLDSLRVFITGAASGIGRATAEAVAAQGGHLVLTDLAADRLAEAADVSDHDAVRRLARRVTDEHGAMDIVMNVAGISAWGTVSSLEHSTWR